MGLIDALTGDKGLVVKFKADLTGLQAGIAQAKVDLTGWRNETNESTSDMAKWGAAIGATVAPVIAVGLAMKSTIDTAEKYQDEIQQFSYVTGMNTDQAQRWRAATIATDTDFGTFTYTMANLNARVTANTTDGEALRKTLTDMGVTVKDLNGNYVDSDTLMKSLLQSFDRMPSAQAKDAAAKEILGRSWMNLAEMINESGDALEAYDKAAPGISQEDLDRVDEFKTRWAQLSDQVTVATAVIGVDLINALDRAKNGYDILYASNPLMWGKMGDALDETRRLDATNPSADWERWKRRLPGTSVAGGSGMNWNMYNGQVASATAANAKADPFAGLTAEEATIKNLKDFAIPDLEKKLKDLQTSGTASYSEIAAASLDLIKAKEELITLTTEETDAQKELKTATDDLIDAEAKLQGLKKDYAREMSLVGNDVAAARNLTTRQKWAIEDQQAAIATTQAKVAGGAGGDFTLIIDGKTALKAPGVISSTAELKNQRIQAGIRTAT